MIAVIFFFVLIIVLYWYSTKNFKYWEKKGVKYDPPVPIFGNVAQQVFLKRSVSELITDKYKRYADEKIIGHFIGSIPALIIRDPEVLKHVLSTDFNYFHPRGVALHNKILDNANDPLMNSIFTVDGDVWKLLRHRMTPAFTSSKLKGMFPLIVQKAEKLQQIATVAAETGEEVDVRELMARYTTDFIGACGFGIEADALNDENSKFRKLGKRIFSITLRDTIVNMLKFASPETFKWLSFFAAEVQEANLSLVTEVMSLRNYKVAGRNDFIDLLLELKEKGKMTGQSLEKRKNDGTPEPVELEMDLPLMAAQAFVFFTAGFETSSSTSSHTLHQLAFHPDIQKKCQEEIDEVLKKYNGLLCYEAVKEMKYLEMTFKESLRVLPPLGIVTRRCAKKYTIPGTNVTIDDHVLIVIPIHALHNDPQYFEHPEEFRPERFHPDNVNKIKKFTYLPFGEGPRACIGERLGLMQSMAGLVAVLSKFSVKPSANSKRQLALDPSAIVVQSVLGGIPLSLVARKKTQ